MQLIHNYAWLVPLLPCMASGIIGIGLLSFRNATRSLRLPSAILSIGMLGISMMFSFGLFWEQISNNSAYIHLWSWINTENVSLEVGYIIDPLSSIMLVLVTTVGVSVMIYTDGYMSHDTGYVRFFAYLSLFTASMLGLVLSPNLLQVYIFWELIGMCSYLLIGFWFTRPSAAAACQKAFITNRVGDFGLLLGILGFYWLTGSFDFTIVTERFHQLINDGSVNISFAILFAICLFLGPVAKSAQFPLHVWLPDAMEGPTPISALIHAATLVAAGIFLVARLLPLFQELPIVMDIIAYTGISTALLGATLAIAQRDLKRGLAYSTMSQLGYMMLALGIGSYEAGLFHLITHAYSKALLFLGSGSVIHGMEGVVGYNPNKSQDMSYMGGIRQYMPITGITFLIGTLSLCGIPPFACFWSKDQILAESWEKMPLLGWMAWLTAGLTAFYMFRIYFLTFEGEFRGSKNNSELVDKSLYPHESSVTMVIPLVILSIPTILIGLLGAPFPDGVPGTGLFSQWLHITNLSTHHGDTTWTEFILESLPSVGIGMFGAFIAWIVYGPHASKSRDFTVALDPLKEGMSGFVLNAIYSWSLRRGYIDELYDHIFVSSTRTLSLMTSWLDQWVIDGAVNSTGLLSLLGGESTKYIETGRTTSYIFVLASATFLLLGAIFFLY
uniref:NAD(P)H-quinone oxidoreductase subunit 5, chloroplastic n=2 Tax=Roya TaxID=43942 RepID=A0A024B4Z6_9VIRI|nr:subunit 5 of NADH-plastoquinone oxidoreductase [Roya anglica]YP_009256926.1 subunit 5 of NADH-plastoquinone oxidoreductase [Roya obtusa]AHZ11148.1 subunit 5 of NADH-plastoquinone oxidoreductase [Roya anglica]ANI25930.1 subunit 5 of NADH-plastoquinone oxidoreductase [Roya obtusa]